MKTERSQIDAWLRTPESDAPVPDFVERDLEQPFEIDLSEWAAVEPLPAFAERVVNALELPTRRRQPKTLAVVLDALLAARGSRSRAAAAIGVSPERVRQLIHRHELQLVEEGLRWAFRPTPWERRRAQTKSNTASHDRNRASRRRLGLCLRCGGARQGVQKHCDTCRKKRAERQAADMQARRERGQCARCWRPAVPEKSQCQKCLTYCAKSKRQR